MLSSISQAASTCLEVVGPMPKRYVSEITTRFSRGMSTPAIRAMTQPCHRRHVMTVPFVEPVKHTGGFVIRTGRFGMLGVSSSRPRRACVGDFFDRDFEVDGRIDRAVAQMRNKFVGLVGVRGKPSSSTPFSRMSCSRSGVR
ncbi:hypothetical protein GQR58_029935 [Nymphon striatum]|nr:hypothetical protein GQR58_029935 [Nymphon striatum]